MQDILIKVWKILGPIQETMDSIVEKIIAPLPPDLQEAIYGAYYTFIWDSKNRHYHKPNFNAPAMPSDPTPDDIDTGVGITGTNLSWECSDADGDPLSYDIYFGTFSPPPLVRSGYKGKTFELEELEKDTTYYWKIVVTDNPIPGAYGGSKTVEGPIWSFTTES
jgi:hypothetical protein